MKRHLILSLLVLVFLLVVFAGCATTHYVPVTGVENTIEKPPEWKAIEFIKIEVDAGEGIASYY